MFIFQVFRSCPWVAKMTFQGAERVNWAPYILSGQRSAERFTCTFDVRQVYVTFWLFPCPIQVYFVFDILLEFLRMIAPLYSLTAKALVIRSYYLLRFLDHI